MQARANRQRQLRLALTGGIGAGKTTALAMLAAAGAAVLDSDTVVHELLGQPDIHKRIISALDIEPLPDGEPGRRQLADAVFDDDLMLSRLEEIVFPLVRRRIREWFGRADVAAAPVAVVELPLLFEAGMEDMFDEVVLITAPKEMRRQRHAGRIGAEDFVRRSRRQLPEEEKRLRAGVVFDNTGSREELAAFVRGLLPPSGSGGG